jgi:membrane associated rhomboid family serine protease
MLDFVCKFASKIIMFQKVLQFWKVIIICYNKQIATRISNQMPPPLHGTIFHIIMNVFFLWALIF